MTASILDGKYLATLKKNEIHQTIVAMKESGIQAPGLAVILVGNDPASQIYVSNKNKACQEVGIRSHTFHLPEETSEQHLVDQIEALNQNSDIDGILVQLPLPESMNTHRIIECIDPQKDVDGFHPYNLGRLAQRRPLLRPCTPFGIIQLLDAYQLPVKGKHTLVIGASNIVGRPMGLEFLAAGATVTIAHRFTQQLEKHVLAAEVIVIATGHKDIVNVEWLQPHQIIIDVGMHRLPDGKLRGDIDFHKACEKVAWITPVPGGVGPMTIAALLQNTVFAAQRRRKLEGID